MKRLIEIVNRLKNREKNFLFNFTVFNNYSKRRGKLTDN